MKSNFAQGLLTYRIVGDIYAYGTAGRFDIAVRTARQAVNAVRDSGRKGLSGEIQDRIKLYQVSQA